MTDVSAQPVAGSNPSQANSNATIISSENEIIAKLKEMFEKETSLDICVDMKNPLSSINLQLLKSLIITACAAGKKIRLVTEIDIHNIDYCKSILQPNIELRHLYDIAGLMILGRTRFVSSVAFEELAAARQLIVSNSADIISHQSRIFRELWEIAIPVKIRISGIENGDQVGKTELVQNPLSAEEIYTNAFHGAQQSILLMLPTVNAFERFRKMGLMDLIKEKGLKGVKVRVLLPANEIVKKEIQNEVSKSKNVKLHFISTSLDKKATIILIIDNRFSMAIEIKDDTNEVFTKTIGFATISTVGSTVHSYKSLFDSYWMHTESYEKLLYAERLKDEFINIAAHELRTPIMPIVGIVEVLMSKVNEEAYSSLRDDIEIIYRNADRLKMLAEDILNVSRIESGNFKLEVSDVDLNSIIAESIIEIRGSYMYWSREQRIRKGSAMSTRGKIVPEYTQNNSLHSMIMNIIGSAAAAEKAILDDAIISFSPVKNIDSNDSICQTSEKNMVDIRCDSKRIKQVVYNLLANALKFSDLNSSSGGKIFVSIVSVGHDRIRIRVKDRGTGIDPSIMDKMFERFTTKSDSGIGLGLYISRRIVETHGGAIGAENNIDGPGATFWFELPISPFSILTFDKNESADRLSVLQREIDQRKTTLEELRDEALTKISDMKTKLLDARDRAVKTRDTAIEEYQKKVQTSRELLRIRQEVLGKQINYNSMRRDIDRRVEKGLEGLSVAIEGIRENLSGDEALEKLSLNPSFTAFVKLEAKKITESQFFKSIKKQIETSNADKEKNLVTADKEEKK